MGLTIIVVIALYIYGQYSECSTNQNSILHNTYKLIYTHVNSTQEPKDSIGYPIMYSNT